jgi:ribonuclease D
LIHSASNDARAPGALPEVRVLADVSDVAALTRAIERAPRIALDVEADGMFAYRARICTVQIAAAGAVSVVDALAAPLTPLARVLSADGPVKVIHDVAFDARMLAEAGLPLGNVHDTSIAARLLGRTATGLAKLALAELGVHVDKGLQHHDWRERPLEPSHLEYLARDVMHLEALAEALWREVQAREIEAEVLEETRYRIASAAAGAAEPERTTAYAGAKGFDRLAAEERAVLRRLWAAREQVAEALDVPAARLVATEALVAMARSRPRTLEALAKTRLSREKLDAVARPFLDAVAQGIADREIPPEERAAIDTPRPPREVLVRRRARDSALSAWRKSEAKRRSVDEQVVLPGHCLKALAEAEDSALGTIQACPGFGACRARYVEPIASVLRGAQEPSTGT